MVGVDVPCGGCCGLCHWPHANYWREIARRVIANRAPATRAFLSHASAGRESRIARVRSGSISSEPIWV